MSENRATQLARMTAVAYARLPQVTAVVLAGSLSAGVGDAVSDIDLYVYSAAEISLFDRKRIAEQNSQCADVDNRFWEPGDEWIDRDTGIKVDVTFRHPHWIEEQINRVLVDYQASTGYSTCFWYNVLASQILFDRDGWYARLQAYAHQPYPEPLRQAIIAKNYPILDRKLSAYSHQIENAVKRGDSVSLNHRIAALLASYFDILFAVNRLPHPGEKRLIRLAEERCSLRPISMRENIEQLIHAADGDDVLNVVRAVVDELDKLLLTEGLITE